MNRALDNLARWIANPNHQIGAAAFILVWLAGHYALAWLLPQGSTGAEFGLLLFLFLTATAAEQARSLRSRSFLTWLVAGLVLSLLVGAVLSST